MAHVIMPVKIFSFPNIRFKITVNVRYYAAAVVILVT